MGQEAQKKVNGNVSGHSPAQHFYLYLARVLSGHCKY